MHKNFSPKLKKAIEAHGIGIEYGKGKITPINEIDN